MNKILSLLGLAQKAGRLVLGTDYVCEALRENKVKMVFLASDATRLTIDKIEKKVYFYQVPLNKSFNTQELNDAIGKTNCKVIGLTDSGFAKKINEYMEVESE